jgi:hypothetical protein
MASAAADRACPLPSNKPPAGPRPGDDVPGDEAAPSAWKGRGIARSPAVSRLGHARQPGRRRAPARGAQTGRGRPPGPQATLGGRLARSGAALRSGRRVTTEHPRPGRPRLGLRRPTVGRRGRLVGEANPPGQRQPEGGDLFLHEALPLGPFVGDGLGVDPMQKISHPRRVGRGGDLRDHRGEGVAQLLGRLEPALPVGGQGPQRHLVQGRGDPGRARGGGHQPRVPHQRQRRRRIQPPQLQELLSGEQLPQHDAQGVDVGAGIGHLAAGLFRRQVGGAPEHHPRGGVLLLQHAAGQPEVSELHVAHVGQQDVGWGHVAMDQLQVAVIVHIGQRPGGLAHHVQRHVQRDALPGAHATVPDLAQVLALDELHGDVELAVHLTGVEGVHQRRMRQPQHHLGLVQEAVGLGAVELLGDHLLDHAQLLEAPHVAPGCQVDLSHAPLRQRFEEHVLAELSREAPRHQQQLQQLANTGPRREPIPARPGAEPQSPMFAEEDQRRRRSACSSMRRAVALKGSRASAAR